MSFAIAQHDRLIRRPWRGWFLLFGIWSVPIALITGANYLSQYSYKEPLTFLDLLGLQAVNWYYWAALSPLVYRFANKFSLATSHWPLIAVLHLVLGFVVSIFGSIIYVVVRPIILGGEFPGFMVAVDNVFDAGYASRHVYNLITYWLTLGVLTTISLNRQRLMREQETTHLELRATQLEARLNSARLEALKMQLQPHFLFNALNSVSSLILNHQNDAAYRAIARLAGLLRTTLDQTEEQTVTLREELEFIKRYLEIEKIRFEERLGIRIVVPEDCMDALLPSLILQPLIENSIRHGIARKIGPGTIEIRARKANGRLIIEAQDDGAGLPPQWSIEDSSGVGLTIVKDRLSATYGVAHDFSITPVDPCGALARISIPFQTNDTDVSETT